MKHFILSAHLKGYVVVTGSVPIPAGIKRHMQSFFTDIFIQKVHNLYTCNWNAVAILPSSWSETDTCSTSQWRQAHMQWPQSTSQQK